MTSRPAAALLIALAGAAAAQVPPEIAAKVRAAGPSMDPGIGALYQPLFPKQPWTDIAVTRDLAYGTDPLQRLDLYAPKAGAKALPVLIFVHGGGFTRGDKHGDFYPDNIPAWAARHGMIGISINYRLAPAHPWPAAAQDLAAAIGWARANIAAHGGDPRRIILWGHSAGANHVADYVAHPEVRGAEATAVRGAILQSPNYTPGGGTQPNVYYGADRALGSTEASIAGLRASTIPLFLAGAEFDPAPFQAYAAAAHAALCATPARCPPFVRLKDTNHFTEGMAVGTADTSLTAPLLAWMRALK